MEANHNVLMRSKEQATQTASEYAMASHEQGKLTARERIELLLDPESFIELDMFAKHRGTEFGMSDVQQRGDGVITGYGTINGRTVFLYAKDSSVFHGTLAQAHARKIAKVQDLALKTRAPIVGIFDSHGARVQEGMAALAGYGDLYKRSIAASGTIPQISLVMGPCPGAEALAAAISDFVFMVDRTSSLFVTGPEVIQAVTSEAVTEDELGGAAVHTTKSAVSDGSYENEVDAIAQVRRLIDFLPSDNGHGAPAWTSYDDPARVEHSLDTLIPEERSCAYDVKELIHKVVDERDFFELQTGFAPNIVTGFARMAGKTIGVVANQSLTLAGVLDGNALTKAARFVRCCDAFGIPVVTFVDTPGFLPGTSEEHSGAARHGAKLLFAYARATVPLVTVVLRNAFGPAYALMASKHIGSDLNYAWPSATLGLMNAKSALEVLNGCGSAEPTEATMSASEYEMQYVSSYAAAEQGYIDDIIAPRETRQHVVRALAMLASKERSDRLLCRHDNVPL